MNNALVVRSGSISNILGQLKDSSLHEGQKAVHAAINFDNEGWASVISEKTRGLSTELAKLRSPMSPSMMPTLSSTTISIGNQSLDEKLFNATSEVKVLTSQVAMYLDPDWRSKLFGQLDSLHEVDEWDDRDLPVKKESFSTFLKAICDIRPKKRPGLGLTPSGQLIASWTNGPNRLTIEFLDNGRVKWVISRQIEGESEQFVGHTQVTRLSESLKPYQATDWFGKC